MSEQRHPNQGSNERFYQPRSQDRNQNNNSNNWKRNSSNNQRNHFERDNKRFRHNPNDHNSIELSIHPHRNYDFASPNFARPRELGSFMSEKRKITIKDRINKALESSDNNNQIEVLENAKGIRFLVLPENCNDIMYDLKQGIEKFVPHVPHQQGINTLLKWVLENKNKLLFNHSSNSTSTSSSSINRILNVDFICWRGLLTTISTMPYENNKDCLFSIVLYKGTYYMCEIESEQNKQERLNMDEKSKSFTYWGHKFESYITNDIPNEIPNGIDDIPDPEDNYATVVNSCLNEHSLLYAAEIDCCYKDVHLDLNDYCEIKTSRGSSIDDLNFNNLKFLKWWIQSYLVNIELIKVGLRNDDGIVNKLIDVNTKDILRSSGTDRKWWKENVCFNFLKSFLDTVKRFCKEENQIYIAYRGIKGQSIRIKKNATEFSHLPNYDFMPDWYKSVI